MAYSFSPLEAATLSSLNNDETNRIKGYKRAWNAYYNNLGDSLRTKPGQPDDNIRVNLCRAIVDYGAAFLFGKDVKFTIEEADEEDFSEVPEPADEETMWLSKLWRKNQQQITLTKLAINGAVCGHAFLKIVAQANLEFPRIQVLDPSLVTVAYSPEDYNDVVGYKIQYNSVDPQTNKPVVMRQLIIRADDLSSWTITDQKSPVTGGIYTIDGSYNPSDGNWQTISTQNWPFLWAPVIDTQNLPAPNQYYGSPDLTEDVIHVSNAINMVLSNRNRVVRLKGHPITWGKGFSANQIDLSPESTIILKTNEAELKHLEMVSDMKPATELYNDLITAFQTVSHVPPVALGQLPAIGQVSGLSLKILYGPMTERTEYKRRLYGYMLEELNSRLIELKFGKKSLSTVVHWPSILPVDDLAQGQSLQMDAMFGVSNDTIMTKRGYDAELEKTKRKAEVADKTANPVVAPVPTNPLSSGGDMRTNENKAQRPDSEARRAEDRNNKD